MLYVSRYLANKYVFTADLTVSELGVGSQRSSGSEFQAGTDHQTGNRKPPTTKLAATMSWDDQLMAAGRTAAHD